MIREGQDVLEMKRHGIEEEGRTRDAGNYAASTRDIESDNIYLQEDSVPYDMKDRIGSNQVTSSAIYLAPSWVIKKAIQSGHEENWKDMYTEVEESDLPDYANVIFVACRILYYEQWRRKFET